VAAPRKNEAALDERDFRAAPVWRYLPESEGEDLEACGAGPVDAAAGVHLVAASVVLAQGAGRGFVRVIRLGNRVETGPLTLFLDGRQLEVQASIPGWNGTRPVADAERRLLPMRWTLDACIGAEPAPRNGRIGRSRLGYFLRATLRDLRLQASLKADSP
jgi:hypothetical protein